MSKIGINDKNDRAKYIGLILEKSDIIVSISMVISM